MSGQKDDIVKSTKFWKDDGSIILILGNEAFKLNRELIAESPKIDTVENEEDDTTDGYEVAVIRLSKDVADLSDFTILLEDFYHETSGSQINTPVLALRLCSIIRVTSDSQLQCPNLHKTACARLEEILQPEAIGALDTAYLDSAEEILGVVSNYSVTTLRKRMLYTVATTSHFEEGPSSHPSLPTELTNICATLQDNLIAHFTPILFTVATASHMACTDIFAEQWMPLVIGPALENSGLCRPIETLRSIQQIEWENQGLCKDCCEEKRAEWEEEIRAVWDKVDKWI